MRCSPFGLPAVSASAIGPVLLSLALVVSPGSRSPRAADRPQWGEYPGRNQVSGETGLPERFDPATGENVRWIVELGTHAHSTPVVAAGRVFIGTNNQRPRDRRRRGDRGILLCLRAEDGALQWQLVVPKLVEDRYLDWPSVGITGSATVEGDRVWLLTNRCEVVCLDLDGLADGNDGPYRDEARYMTPAGETPVELGPTDADILWRCDLRAEVAVWPHDSSCSSILIDGDRIWVNTSNGVDNTHRRVASPGAPSLVALEKRTGRLLAREDAGIGPNIVHCTWASPSMGRVGDRNLVFFGGGDGICYAFDTDFEVVENAPIRKLSPYWRFDCDPTGPRGDLPRYQDDREKGPSNISGMPVFSNGRVYVTAGGDVWHGKPRSWLKCIDASGSGDITGSAEVWSFEMPSHCLSTPSLAGGLVWIADYGRRLHCLEAASGREIWSHRTRGVIWGSSLVADGKVYIGSRSGDLWVLEAGRQKRVISSVSLGAPISATPVAANGVLYIATMRRLFAFEKGARRPGADGGDRASAASR